MSRQPRPIGIFDSGIGGLTIAAAIRKALPMERLLYFGDTAHIPYGQRDLPEILQFSRGITELLIAQDCKLIVIACNTASAAALEPLRVAFPNTPFVGMEPAVKPAAESSRTKKVGVLATTATFQGKLFASVVERFAGNVTVLQQPCPGLVAQIEKGELETPATEAMLRGWIEPMMNEGIDALVLGCTHYPLTRPLIESIVGDTVRVIDPSAAVTQQIGRVLEQQNMLTAEGPDGILECITTGSQGDFSDKLKMLNMGSMVHQATWNDNARALRIDQ